MSRCISYWKMVILQPNMLVLREANSPFCFLFGSLSQSSDLLLDWICLKQLSKVLLREVEGFFRLFNSRKDLFMNHLSGPKGPQFPESANLFHDHRSTSITYKTIQISTSLPKKTQLQSTQYVQDFHLFFSHFFGSLHKKSSNEQTNNTTSRHPLHHRQTRWFFAIASPHIVTMTFTRLSHLLPWNFQGDH